MSSASNTEFEQGLRQQGYTPLPDFAIIDECDFVDRKTGQRVNLDKTRLQKIANEQNRLVAERNSAPVICLGHTKDDVPEEDQPPVVGYATAFRLGRFKDGRHAIFARPWAKPGSVQLKADSPSKTYVQIFKDNPQRSSEVWLNPDSINPIALLGSTTPRRDLGIHLVLSKIGSHEYADPEYTSSGSVIRFSRQEVEGRFPILFQARDGEEDMPAEMPVKCAEGDTPNPGDDTAAAQAAQGSTAKGTEAKLDQIIAALGKMSQVFDMLLQEEGQEHEGNPADAAPPTPGQDGPPAAAGPPEPAEPEPKGPARNSASAGGYGNNFMPGYDTSTPVRQSRDADLNVRMSRLEAENRVLLARVKESEAVANAANLALLTKDAKAFVARIGEQVVIDEEHDFNHIVRLSRDKWPEVEAHMLKVRAKVDRAKIERTPLPGSNGFVINPELVGTREPMRLSRDASNVYADPNIQSNLPDSYDEMVAKFKEAGGNAQALLSQAAAPVAAAGVTKVR